MRPRAVLFLSFLLLATWGVILGQKPWKQYPGGEDGDIPYPPDYQQPAEWSSSRLKYRDGPLGFRRGGGFFGRRSEGAWATDYPLGDRHLIEGVRRLTRINTRSVEQVVELD